MSFNPNDVGHVVEHNRISDALVQQDITNPGGAAGLYAANHLDVTVAGSDAQLLVDHKYGTTLNAIANGVVGDGTTDDAAALQALLNTAVAIGASVTLAAGSTVLCGSTVVVPSGTRLYGNGALLKKSAALAGILFTVTTATNILFQNFRIDGQKSLFTANEYQHGIYIVNASSNVTLRDLDIGNCNGDGIYVGDQTAASSNVTLENVTSHDNTRQGMSISHVSGLEAFACRFTGSTGKNPQGGVDIEPNNGTVVCENIKFTDCIFSGNYHFGFVVAFAYTITANQGGIELIGCTLSGNGVANDTFGGGLNLRAAQDFTMTGGTIIANTGPGVLIDWTARSTNIKFCGVNVASNTTHGLFLSASVVGLFMSLCTVKNNGTATAATYDGISLQPTAASSSIHLIGNLSTGGSQRYGLLTNSNVSYLDSRGNDYTGNGTGNTSLGDDQTTRVQMDGASGVWKTAREFFYSTAAATILSMRLIGDTGDRTAFLTDGRVLFGSGSGSADTQLSRVAVGVLATGAAQSFRTGVAVSGSRPSATTVGKGSQFYDSTLSKPIWSDGTVWRDAAGATV